MPVGSDLFLSCCRRRNRVFLPFSSLHAVPTKKERLSAAVGAFSWLYQGGLAS